MIIVTNKVSATLSLKTKDETYYIPPRVRGMKIDLNSEDVVSSAPQLIISEAGEERPKRRRRSGKKDKKDVPVTEPEGDGDVVGDNVPDPEGVDDDKENV